MIRVLLGDTSPLFLRGARAAIREQDDMEIVGEVREGDDFPTLAVELDPDVIIYGTHQSGGRAHDLTRSLRLHAPNSRVVLFAEEEDEEVLFAAVKAGA